MKEIEQPHYSFKKLKKWSCMTQAMWNLQIKGSLWLQHKVLYTTMDMWLNNKIECSMIWNQEVLPWMNQEPHQASWEVVKECMKQLFLINLHLLWIKEKAKWEHGANIWWHNRLDPIWNLHFILKHRNSIHLSVLKKEHEYEK